MSMLIILKAKGLHYLLEVIHEWRDKYHSLPNGDIIFQNKATYTNVRWNNNSMHTISKHSAGFENIPETILEPDEIWMNWEDPKDQKVVTRNYIKFGADASYIVQTRNGVVMDAFAVSNGSANQYRKGIIFQVD